MGQSKNEYDMLNVEIEEEIKVYQQWGVGNTFNKKEILNDYKDKLNQFLNTKISIKSNRDSKKIIDGKDILPGKWF